MFGNDFAEHMAGFFTQLSASRRGPQQGQGQWGPKKKPGKPRPEVSRSSSNMPTMSRSPIQSAGSSPAALTLTVLTGKKAACMDVHTLPGMLIQAVTKA